MHSRILGTGSYLPARVVSNDELAQRVDTSDEWIVSRSGIRQRHIAAEWEATSDLAKVAGERALAAAGLDATAIDLIIVATTTPDMIFPSTACIVQDKLGLRHGAAFDLQAVCSGFVYALTVADRLVASGGFRNALVIGSEIYSRILDWNDRGTCVLFGDGAGAVVLGRSEQPGIIAWDLNSDGSHRGILCVPGSIDGGRVTGTPFVHMDGGAVFKFAVRVLAETAAATLAKAGLGTGQIDWLIPHQANIRIIEATAKKLHLPMTKVIATVDRHANTSAASIPLALDVAVRDGRVRAGQRLMLAGVGGGFTWGSVLLRW